MRLVSETALPHVRRMPRSADADSLPRLTRTRRGGMTMIELLTVVTIIGILALVSFPRIVSLQEQMRIDDGAQQFARRLNGAQIEALKRNRTVRVRRFGASTYEVDGKTRYSLPKGVRFDGGPTEIEFAPFGPPLAGSGTFQIVSGERGKTVRLTTSGFASVK